MAKSKEILDIYFTQEEKTKVETEMGKIDGFKDKYEKVKLAQVDSQLDDLAKRVLELGEKNDESFDRRFNDFKKAIEEKEKELFQQGEKGVVATVKDKATQAIDTKKQELKNKFLEKIGEIPLIGGFLKDAFTWTEESETAGKWDFGKKIAGFFGGMILGFFGFNELKKQLEGVKGENIPEAVIEGTTKAVTTAGGLVDDVMGKVKEKSEELEKINPETIKSGYHFLGMKYLQKVSSSSVLFEKDKNNYSLFIYTLKDKNYGELKQIREKILKNSNNQDEINKLKNELGINSLNLSNEHFIGMLDTLVGFNASIVFKNFDHKKIIEKKYFREKFGDTYDHLKNENIDNISLNDLLFLLGYSLPVGILGLGSNIVNYLPKIDDLDKYGDIISSEVENRKEGFFSKQFLVMLGSGFNEPGMFENDNKILKEKVENKINNEKNNKIKTRLENDLRLFIIFKDSIITTLNSNTYKITEDFNINFINKLSPKDILGIYLLFDGKTDLTNLNSIDKIFMYSWILTITEDPNKRDNYIQKLIQKSNVEPQNYLSAEEIDFLRPILGREGYKIFIESTANMALHTTNIAQSTVVSVLKENNINIPEINNTYDYIDYAILGVLIGGNFLTYKLPLPLPWKIIISGAFATGGATQLFGILKKRGKIDQMLQDVTLPNEIKLVLSDLNEKGDNKSDFSFTEILSKVDGFFN